MVGAAVAAAGWRRRTALATPAGIIAANIPDVDIVTVEAGEFASLALRRGWTHGPPAVLLGAFVTVGAMLLWERARRRRRPDAPPARVAPLLALSIVAALTHPLLDWMNTYGIRFLMPFDRAWYYGDALFIVDPWLWLLLGIPLFLIHSPGVKAMSAWALIALLMTALVVGTTFVPITAKVVWIVAILAAVALRLVRRRQPRAHAVRIATLSVSAAAVYVAGMVLSSSAAAQLVRRAADQQGIDVRRIMIAPRPARPLQAEVVIEDSARYRFGTFDWLGDRRVVLEREPPLPRGAFDDIARAAARHPHARDFLVWSRFPVVETRSAPDGGYIVRFGDARYVRGPGSGTLGGVTIRLDIDGRGTRTTE